MTPPRRRQSDKWLRYIWIKLSILVLVLGAVVTLMTNLFGSRIKPEIAKRLTSLESDVSIHKVEAAAIKTNQTNIKELILRLEKKVDRLLYRRANTGGGGNSVVAK